MTTAPKRKNRAAYAGLTTDLVCATLREERGLLARASDRLGVSRTTLMNYCRSHPTCHTVLKECREALCDTAEQALWKLVEAGDYRAVQFILVTLGKDRGYVLPKNSVSPIDGNGDAGVGVVTTINIIAIPSGKFLTPEESAELEGRPLETYQPESRSSEHLRLIDGDEAS
jgi:hypothetical protein